jgi:hypothetical protein
VSSVSSPSLQADARRRGVRCGLFHLPFISSPTHPPCEQVLTVVVVVVFPIPCCRPSLSSPLPVVPPTRGSRRGGRRCPRPLVDLPSSHPPSVLPVVPWLSSPLSHLFRLRTRDPPHEQWLVGVGQVHCGGGWGWVRVRSGHLKQVSNEKLNEKEKNSLMTQGTSTTSLCTPSPAPAPSLPSPRRPYPMLPISTCKQLLAAWLGVGGVLCLRPCLLPCRP